MIQTVISCVVFNPITTVSVVVKFLHFFNNNFNTVVVVCFDVYGGGHVGVNNKIELADNGDKVVHPLDVDRWIKLGFDDVKTRGESNGHYNLLLHTFK